MTGCSRGYGFVEFVHEEDFTSAFYGAHRTMLDGSQILVDFMRAQTVPGWVPRRLGGGVGGKKQSGQMRFGGRDCPFHAPYDSNRFIRKPNSGNVSGSKLGDGKEIDQEFNGKPSNKERTSREGCYEDKRDGKDHGHRQRSRDKDEGRHPDSQSRHKHHHSRYHRSRSISHEHRERRGERREERGRQ